MSLEKIIADATCEGCKNNAPKAKNGDHLYWCGTRGCHPGVYSGHIRSCDSAVSKELMKVIRTYLKKSNRTAFKRGYNKGYGITKGTV
jgi:hypothetical protein